MRMAERSRKKRIWIKYWRPSRIQHPPLALIQVPMMRVRTSQTRKRRLLQVQVQSSGRHRVLVVSHRVVPLPPQVGAAQWQEA